MSTSAYDIREFYTSKTGQFVQKTLNHHLQKVLEDTEKQQIIGVGYTAPYLNAEKDLNITPSILGAYLWPDSPPNRACVANIDNLPINEESVDCALIIHALEFLDYPAESLAEIWHSLKGNGRLILVIPNRSGFWAGSDQTPFGQGQPYSLNQIRKLLRSENFIIENISTALYTPPWRSNLLLKGFSWLEKAGQVLPFFPGVYIVEAKKQIAGITKPHKATRSIIEKRIPLGEITPQPG